MANNDIHTSHAVTPLRRGALVLAAAALLAGCGTAPAASPASTTTTAPARPGPSVLTPAASKVIAAGAVGYLARVSDGQQVYTAQAGLADRTVKRPIGADDQFEIGSNTKTFTSVIMLQLEAEGRLSLDDTLDKHLPGLVPGGDRITVRQILNHTSGLFDYTADPQLEKQLSNGTNPDWTPRHLVQVAMKHKPYFAPGTSWHYSNTNYVLAELIAQKLTGQPMATLVDQRIARPLGLKRTYFVTDRVKYSGPGVAHGYSSAFDTTPPKYADVTNWSLGGWAGGAGAVMSTPSELATFFSSLMSGRLVAAKQLNEMRTLVDVPKEWKDDLGIAGYGLGLIKFTTPCGTVWGHGGDTNGHHSTAVVTADGRRVAITDTTTQPTVKNKAAQKLIAASTAGETAATCLMLGKRVPAAG